MNALEFALWSCLILAAWVFYKIVTMRLALNARNAMVPIVHDILEDEKLPHQIKLFALGAFHLSVAPWLLPTLFACNFLYKKEIDAMDTKAFSDHAQLTDKLIREHLLKINVLVAPHWYALLFLCVMLAVIGVGLFTLGLKSGTRVFTAIEKALSSPETFVLRHATTSSKAK